MNELEREVGRLGGIVDTLERDLLDLRVDVKQILAMLNEAKGGWKMLIAVGALSGAAGALLIKLGMWGGWIPK